MKSNTNTRLIALVVVLIICTFSLPGIYAGEFNYEQMNLVTNIKSKILPLASLDGNLSNRQYNLIMRNGFFVSEAENYGYCTLTLSSNYLGSGKHDTGVFVLGYVGSLLTAGTGFLFLPMGKSRYQLTVNLQFFDCNKKQISVFTSSTIYDGLTKLVKDNYTYKTESLYRNLLKNCLTAASKEADKINTALLNAKNPPPPPVEKTVADAFKAISGQIPVNSSVATIGANTNSDVVKVTRLMEANFVSANNFYIVDRSNIDLILDEIAFSRTVFVGEAIEIGKMLAACYIVFCEITGEGANKVLCFRVLSVEEGKVIAIFNSPFQS